MWVIFLFYRWHLIQTCIREIKSTAQGHQASSGRTDIPAHGMPASKAPWKVICGLETDGNHTHRKPGKNPAWFFWVGQNEVSVLGICCKKSKCLSFGKELRSNPSSALGSWATLERSVSLFEHALSLLQNENDTDSSEIAGVAVSPEAHRMLTWQASS